MSEHKKNKPKKKREEPSYPTCPFPPEEMQESQLCEFCGYELDRVYAFPEKSWEGPIDFGYRKHSKSLQDCVKLLASKVENLMRFMSRVTSC